MGFPPDLLAKFNEMILKPHGMILVTGPTGSGKTTTLYGALQKINDPGKKIITIEDPVEYQLGGVNQIHVKPQIGLTFANGLRSIVRQDPDVIMVGEIRDAETAEIAVQAALTGHLVLFDFAHQRCRGRDFASAGNGRAGLSAFVVASGRVGAKAGAPPLSQLSQRSSVCRRRSRYRSGVGCSRRAVLCDAVWEAVGCNACNGTGYLGRVGIFELLAGDFGNLQSDRSARRCRRDPQSWPCSRGCASCGRTVGTKSARALRP